MTNKIIDILKNGGIVVPRLLLTNYKKLNITDKELIVLIYLIDNNDFNPEKISNDLKIDDFLNIVDSLVKKDVVKIETKVNNKIHEEYVCLDELYNKLALLLIENPSETKDTTIFDLFEKEFARSLSPMEYEIIGAWLDSGISEQLICEALKEATYNGVSNLRYIDKILSEWQKKGVKDKKDIEKARKDFKKKEKKEIDDVDWLNED